MPVRLPSAVRSHCLVGRALDSLSYYESETCDEGAVAAAVAGAGMVGPAGGAGARRRWRSSAGGGFKARPASSTGGGGLAAASASSGVVVATSVLMVMLVYVGILQRLLFPAAPGAASAVEAGLPASLLRLLQLA